MHLDHRLLPFTVEILDVIYHRFKVTLDHSDWSAKFMGNVGDKIFSHHFESMKLRDIPNNNQSIIFSKECNLNLQSFAVVPWRVDVERFIIDVSAEIFGEFWITYLIRHRQ